MVHVLYSFDFQTKNYFSIQQIIPLFFLLKERGISVFLLDILLQILLLDFFLDKELNANQ